MSNIDGIDEWLRSECIDFLSNRNILDLYVMPIEELRKQCRRVKGIGIEAKSASK